MKTLATVVLVGLTAVAFSALSEDDAFFQKLEHRKALARSFMDANLKK